MQELPKNKIERKVVLGSDFVDTLKTNDILKEIGEDPYKSELRFDIAEIISNLSRMLEAGSLRSLTKDEIESQIDAALLGERKSLTKINLTEERRQRIKEVILNRLQKFIE